MIAIEQSSPHVTVPRNMELRRGQSEVAATLLGTAADAVILGPLLIGLSEPAQVLAPNVSPREVTNLTAVAAARTS